MPSNQPSANLPYESLAVAIVLQAVKDYKTHIHDVNNSYCESIKKFLRNGYIVDYFPNLDLTSLLNVD